MRWQPGGYPFQARPPESALDGSSMSIQNRYSTGTRVYRHRWNESFANVLRRIGTIAINQRRHYTLTLRTCNGLAHHRTPSRNAPNLTWIRGSRKVGFTASRRGPRVFFN